MARKRSKSTGPQLVQFFGPLLEALRELGGSGRPAEVKDLIAQSLQISEQEQNELLESGVSRFSKNVDWARFYLAKTGYIGSSERGVWSLTEMGLNTALTYPDAVEIYYRMQAQVQAEQLAQRDVIEQAEDFSEAEFVEETAKLENANHRTLLLSLLRELPPSGFERFCQRLLREAGFQQVTVTGRSGDGGLDGFGILQVNPLVSFKVYFQCKRYSGSVSPAVI